MGFNINPFGIIPFNPENLPEAKFLFGEGSPRPVGFTPAEITKLYWTVRRFQVSITANFFVDAFAAVVVGASTGTLVGTTIGLSAAANALSQGGGSLQGKTKAIRIVTTKNRVKPTPKEGRPTPNLGSPCNGRSNFQEVAANLQKFNHTVQLVSKNPKSVNGINDNVNEGIICGAGPVHILQQSAARIEINFSNIIYAKGRFWPIIKITMPLITSFLYDITPSGGASNFVTGTAIGGINFMGNVITLYSTNESLLNIAFAFGDVTIAGGCCDRLYFDGQDKKRIEDYCVEGCKEAGLKSETEKSHT